MITIFWFISACMLLLALAFVLMPIIRYQHNDSDELRNNINIYIHKEHLQELEDDFEEGNIDEEEFNDAKQELERNLLTDVIETGKENGHIVSKILLKTIIPIVVVLPVFVVVTYLMLGDVNMVNAHVDKELQQTNRETMHAIEEKIAELNAHLQEQPENGEGWRLLARSYLVTDRYQDAVDAYRNARKYMGDDPQLLADYAGALISANNNNPTEEAENLINLSLQANPNESKALWIAGYAGLKQGNTVKTLHYWERLLNVLVPGSDDWESVKKSINQVKQSTGMVSSSKNVSDTGVIKTPVDAITVHVNLAAALQGKANPEDTVFIFAHASEGPRMPLAIIRKQVKDLPVNVTLDDSMSMSPDMSLSKFKQVIISARVSKSGDATPHSGDLSGSSTAIQPSEVTGVKITIDQILP